MPFAGSISNPHQLPISHFRKPPSSSRRTGSAYFAGARSRAGNASRSLFFGSVFNRSASNSGDSRTVTSSTSFKSIAASVSKSSVRMIQPLFSAANDLPVGGRTVVFSSVLISAYKSRRNAFNSETGTKSPSGFSNASAASSNGVSPVLANAPRTASSTFAASLAGRNSPASSTEKPAAAAVTLSAPIVTRTSSGKRWRNSPGFGRS